MSVMVTRPRNVPSSPITTNLLILLSIIFFAELPIVVSKETVMRGTDMICFTRTLLGSTPADVTFRRMSLSVTIPIGPSFPDTTRHPTSFSTINAAASLAVESGLTLCTISTTMFLVFSSRDAVLNPRNQIAGCATKTITGDAGTRNLQTSVIEQTKLRLQQANILRTA